MWEYQEMRQQTKKATYLHKPRGIPMVNGAKTVLTENNMNNRQRTISVTKHGQI